MSEHPILMSGPMVRATLAGIKTQTRRPITRIAGYGPIDGIYESEPGWLSIVGGPCISHEDILFKCPYGWPGDTLWVRETWRPYAVVDGDAGVFFRADKQKLSHERARRIWTIEGATKWRPSIHMPRWASRIDLVIKKIRVERLQDISEEDALAEGSPLSITKYGLKINYDNHVDAFIELWDSINLKRGHGWDENPWVWVVEYEMTKGGEE